MKARKDVEAFKNELRQYEYIQERIKEFNDAIQLCVDALGGSPKSVDFSRVVVHSPPNTDFEYKMRDRISSLEAERRPWSDRKKRIDRILATMESSIREDIIDVYVKGNSLAKISERRYIIASTLHWRVNKAIGEALDYERKKSHLI